MNFDLSEEQQLLAESLKRYLANEYYDFDARAKIVASPTGWSETVWAAFAEMGLLGVPFAEEHGGFGGTAVDVMLVMEAIGEGLVVEPYLVTVGLGGRLIARGGSDAQQKRILPALDRRASIALAFAHTERERALRPGARSVRARSVGRRLHARRREARGPARRPPPTRSMRLRAHGRRRHRRRTASASSSWIAARPASP